MRRNAAVIVFMLMSPAATALGQSASEPPVYVGETYYVATAERGGSNRSDGRQAIRRGPGRGPWLTIQHAVNSAKPGDTICVRQGKYFEQISITTSSIRLKAFDNEQPLIDGQRKRDYGICDTQESAIENVSIEGFEIANQTRMGICLSHRQSQEAIIRGNIIHHTGVRGVDVRGTRHRIEDNLIYMIGNDQESMGIRLAGAEDCVIENNDVFLCKKTAIRDQTGKRNLIQSNLMHECWTGLDLNSSSGAKVFNNVIYNNCQGANPKHVKGSAGWNRLWHNTFYGNHGPHISIAVNRATGYEDSGPDCDYLDIRNNILLKCGATHIWNKPDIVGEHLVIDGNLYHGPPGWPPFFYHTQWPRSGRPGLKSIADVRRRTPFMSTGVDCDPHLIDPDGGNFDYTSNSPVVKGGAALDSPFGNQLGARGLRRPAARFLSVPMKPIAASTSENLMKNTTDGRYCTGWHSNERTANQWIVYELASRQPFTHLVLTPVGHKVEFNVRRYQFAVSDDNRTYLPLLAGENNDSGSTFIYELDQPVAPRYLKFVMLDTFPDDGHAWSLDRIEFDELTAGYCSPSLERLPESVAGSRPAGKRGAGTVVPTSDDAITEPVPEVSNQL